ncbi:MAG: hypothetical protein ACPGSK_03340, partial [Alphaproteobacteria bacterium]
MKIRSSGSSQSGRDRARVPVFLSDLRLYYGQLRQKANALSHFCVTFYAMHCAPLSAALKPSKTAAFQGFPSAVQA